MARQSKQRRIILSPEPLEDRCLLAGDLPHITEFMASNSNTLEDGNGKAPDWIEIYNPTDTEVDLAGWSLTDDPQELTKWTFPDHASSVLAPFEYLVVFASDDNNVDSSDNLHTNFKLSAGGDYLALANPEQAVISEFGEGGALFPPQTTDASYGIEGAAFESADIRYVDATAGSAGNTRLTLSANGNTVFEPAGIDISNQGADGKWEQRTFGNGGTIFETGVDTRSDDGPALTTVIDGLEAGTYQVFAYLWSDTNNNWDLQLGLAADALQAFSPTTPGVQSLANMGAGGGLAQEGYVPPILVTEGNRTLFQVPLGERTISDGEALEVFIDDLPNEGGRSWYDGVGVRRSQSAVTPTSPAFYLVPQNDDLGTSWTEIDFDATANGFTDGQAAVGFENNAGSDTSFANLISTSIPSGTGTAYVRIPFQVTDVGTVSGLRLQLQYDDGFVAYLNGQPVLSRFAPTNLDHASTAEDSRSDDETLAGDTFSLSSFQSLLVEGQNVLAFHMLNYRTTSSDFLLRPELQISNATGSGEIRYFSEPTPGGPNGLGFLGFVEDTSFSIDRGFYDQPFDVAISSKTLDASIYFTLDGSEPGPENPQASLYVSPIRIERTTNLRAAAFKEGFQPTNVDTQSYIFLSDVLQQDPRNSPNDARAYPATWQGNVVGDYEIDPRVVAQWSDENPSSTDTTLLDGLKSIPTMSLTLDHEDLWDRATGIYPNANERSAVWRRAGSVEYIDPNSDAEFQYNVGIQMHGAASSFNERLLKHSFRLRFSPQYDGPSKLKFPLFDNSDFADINQVVLRAAFTDAFATRTQTDRYSPLDSTYMRDVWMRDAQLAAGGSAAQSTYVHLYINGLYWGLYNPAERTTDEQYFVSHFGGEQEDWDILKDFNELSAGNRDAWNTMFALARSITNANADDKFQEIQGLDSNGFDDPNRPNYLNMDRFIDYIALHLYAGVEDWPSHNWHAGRNRVNPGDGFEFLTWDQEIGLDQLARDRRDASNSNTPGELFQALRRSGEFRLRMADRIQALFFNDGALTVENNQARWMARADQIEQAIIGESARWGDAREGQRVTAYSSRSPLDGGVGQIRRGTQTIPLMTIDHWRDSVTYVQETFFPGGFDLFLQRMRADSMFPTTAAPSFTINDRPQHAGAIARNSLLTIQGDGDIYYTLDGNDPREPGGGIRGLRYAAPIPIAVDTTVNARALVNGEWSPLLTSTFLVPTVPTGDFNGDSVVNSRDIDAIFAAINSNSVETRFDMNNDGTVSVDDSDVVIEEILRTRRGDFDLNGKVEFADFLVLSANFGKQTDTTWDQGDADGDGTIGFADFLLLSSNFGFDNDGGV